MTYVPYPIPDPYREELIEAGQIACRVGGHSSRTGQDYRAAHARVEKAIAAIYERFGYEEDEE